MNNFIYNIKSPILKPWIQYILFNRGSGSRQHTAFQCFANTNYCLGISKNNKWSQHQGSFVNGESISGIHSYLSGIYLQPLEFHTNEELDEICIDFTPLGYYQFFNQPAKTFLFNDDMLTEAFGKEGVLFFEKVFEKPDFIQRGIAIENFLLTHYRHKELFFLSECLSLMNSNLHKQTVHFISRSLKCSERKLHRYFIQYFDVSPSEYLRVIKFRRALDLVKQGQRQFTEISYQCDYYDQSHMIREFHFFAGASPQVVKSGLQEIDGAVMILTK